MLKADFLIKHEHLPKVSRTVFKVLNALKAVQKLQCSSNRPNASQVVENLSKQSRNFQKLLEHCKGFQMIFN